MNLAIITEVITALGDANIHILKFYTRLVPHFLKFMHYDRCVLGLTTDPDFTLQCAVRKIISGEKTRIRICGLSARQRTMFSMYCEYINVMPECRLVVPWSKCASCHGAGYINYEICTSCNTTGSQKSVANIIVTK